MATLVRQSPFSSEQQKILKQIQIETYFKDLTERGQQVYHERVLSLNKFPNDPKFIKCTFIPGQGWDMTEREAKHFIRLMDGTIVSTTYQPALEEVRHESDAYDYIWIGFE